MSSDSAADGLQLNDPQTLYRRWEDSQWSPFAVDLERDRGDWRAMDGPRRELVQFVLASLMVAEARITTKFAGLVAAHGSEEEATFLATQQVDEARHMQFYARFQDEVLAEPQAIAAHVERARAHLSDGFRHIFDEALVRFHEELIAAPGDLAAKVRFITPYHQILEGTLGLTTFKFVTDYLREQDLLPGFVEGYSRIAADEQRHLAYGTWFLRESASADPAMAEVIRGRIQDLLPDVAEALQPPGEGAFDALGVDEGALAEFGLGALNRRLAIIGIPPEAKST